MTSNEKLTLHLLRSALWNTDADLSLFKKGVDWGDILRIAEKQGTISLVASAIRRLEDLGLGEDILPNEIINKCVTLQFSVIRVTNSVIPTLNSVVNVLKEKGIEPILLKGQAVAAYYFKPEFRYCGDIDLYLGKDYADKAFAMLKEYNQFEDDSNGNEKHGNMRWQGIEVELHRTAIDLVDTKDNKALYEWTEKELNSGHNRLLRIGEIDVTIPSELFDAIFVMQHLWWHFVKGGTGIRQFCDWTMCLYQVADCLDKEELKSLLQRFGLLGVWRAFGHVAVDQLGLPREKCPLYSNRKRFLGEKLASIAMEYGNFGQEQYQHMVIDSVKKGVIVHKWMTAVYFNKLKFWCFLASPRATWPVIKDYYKDLFLRYFGKG
ncbi:MAG: nucleotidyltransferase family protein [Prevotella sp.]|nr:nucleotidyltransferase family protein [Prevotella sp.]